MLSIIKNWFKPTQITDDEYYNLEKSYDRSNHKPQLAIEKWLLKREQRKLKPLPTMDGIIPKMKSKPSSWSMQSSTRSNLIVHYVSPRKKAVIKAQ